MNMKPVDLHFNSIPGDTHACDPGDIISFETGLLLLDKMDVTEDNFLHILPEIQELLKKAIFVSFDEEMTGIYSKDFKNSKIDDPETRYAKMIEIANRFSIIQFGICIFYQDTGSESLKCKSYNFYVFPTNKSGDIILSVSAVEFLKKNKMDFGLWLSKSIGYVDEEGDSYYYKKLIQPDETPVDPNVPKPVVVKQKIILTKQSDIDFMDKNFERFKTFLNDDNLLENFQFDSCNSYLRRVIWQSLDEFPNVNATVSTSNPNVLTVR